MKNHWLETLAELERIQTEATHGISIIKKMMALDGRAGADLVMNGAPATSPEAAPATTVSGDSLAQRMRELFKQNPTQSFSVAEILHILGDSNEKGIGGTINRLYDKDFIQRISRGKYRLHRKQQQPEVSRDQLPS
jgi:hypothetical protein